MLDDLILRPPLLSQGDVGFSGLFDDMGQSP